jgi:DNA-binding transcriptional LysR family regulator
MSVDLDTGILRAYLAVVRCGSVSRAARLTGRTQPALSQQLRRLEALLGQRLLKRSSIGVCVTPSGQALIPVAERILAVLDSIPAPGGGDDMRGTCRVGVAEDVVGTSLMAALAQLRGDHPKLKVDLVIGPANELLRKMQAAKLDLVIGDPGQLRAKPGRSRARQLVWVASAHFDAKMHPLPLVLYRAPCQWSRQVLGTLTSAGVASRVAFQSGNVAALAAACRAGVGVAASLREDVPRGCIVVDASAQLPPAPTVSLGLYRNRQSSGFALVDFVERWIWPQVC